MSGDDRQLVLNLFELAVLDPPLRDNKDTMHLPFLSLQKGRRVDIEYRRNNVYIVVMAPPQRYGGIASIWDWDIIIGIQSIINEHRNKGLPYGPRMQFAPYHLLDIIGRGTSGRHYRELAQGIRRLHYTSIETNVRFEDTDHGSEKPMNWLVDYDIPKKYSKGHSFLTEDDSSSKADSSRPWVVELSQWLYKAVIRQTEILAVHPDYFKLTGGLERWLYRLARKAVPKGGGIWSYRMDTLFEISGVSGRYKNFATKVRKIAESDGIPEYSIEITTTGTGRKKREMVHLRRNLSKPGKPIRGLTDRLPSLGD